MAETLENLYQSLETRRQELKRVLKMFDTFKSYVSEKVYPETGLGRKELETALNDLKKAVELDTKFIDAYYSMAVIYKNLEDYKLSIDALDKILEIDEQSINARALKKLLLKKYLN